MGKQGGDSATGHLAYYTAHAISPVSYDTRDLAAHFDRRDSLYRTLGLPPAAFRGVDVLEIAPGSGQNGLYIAAQMPRGYDLVEPNPTGIAHIKAAYAGFARPHTEPRIHAARFEAFEPGRTYDVVICENWLGWQPQERVQLRRLAQLVAPGGVLVVTIVPPSGFFPNVFRKLLALRLTPPGLSYAEQVEFLTGIFGAHLATLGAMTRSHEDWIKDCLLNPHYLNVVLPLETVFEDIGDRMEILGSAPAFRTDWRWFKSLVGTARDFNMGFGEAYRENLHNFVDSRRTFPAHSAAANLPLETACRALHAAALDWQNSQATGATDHQSAFDAVSTALGALEQSLGEIDAHLAATLGEMRTVWDDLHLEPSRVRDMQHFAGLFGRETLYVSWTAPR